MNEEVLKGLLEQFNNYPNPYGEKVTLVGATKFVDVETINKAIKMGLTDIAENKAQEFKDKFDKVLNCNYRFIGHLQKNKVKYLIGKAYLIESVDTIELLDEINRQSENKNVNTSVLLEIDVSGDENKSGFSLNDVKDALKYSKTLKNVTVKGFMTMLKNTDDNKELILECKTARSLYDEFKNEYNLSVLSMGMSNDFLIAIANGSNEVRIGTYIFGKRNYNV